VIVKDLSDFEHLAQAIAALFAVVGVAHLLAPRALRDAYARWHFPRGFYRVTGTLELLAALFLSVPILRIWGVALAAIITFVAVITLLNHRQYVYAVPGMLLMMALAPALLATPF
jgi:hypothetical protein